MKPNAVTLIAAWLLTAVFAQAQPSGRQQLREALTEYYAHVVTEKLELSDRQAKKLRPHLDDLMAAQTAERSAARGIQRRLQESLRASEPDPEEVGALLAEFLDAEAGAHQRLQEARRELVSRLTPRQQATFLLSEGEYRQAVMRHLRELRSGERAPERQPGQDSPWRRERQERGPRDGGRVLLDEGRQTDLRENLTLLLAFQVRNQARVPLERIVDLLPRLEGAVQAQLDLAQLEQGAERELQAALDSDVKDPELKRLVATLLDEQVRLGLRLHEARRAVVDGLDPVAGARFVHLQDRFRKDAPSRLRMMQRMMSGEGASRPAREQRDRPMQRRRQR